MISSSLEREKMFLYAQRIYLQTEACRKNLLPQPHLLFDSVTKDLMKNSFTCGNLNQAVAANKQAIENAFAKHAFDHAVRMQLEELDKVTSLATQSIQAALSRPLTIQGQPVTASPFRPFSSQPQANQHKNPPSESKPPTPDEVLRYKAIVPEKLKTYEEDLNPKLEGLTRLVKTCIRSVCSSRQHAIEDIQRNTLDRIKNHSPSLSNHQDRLDELRKIIRLDSIDLADPQHKKTVDEYLKKRRKYKKGSSSSSNSPPKKRAREESDSDSPSSESNAIKQKTSHPPEPTTQSSFLSSSSKSVDSTWRLSGPLSSGSFPTLSDPQKPEEAELRHNGFPNDVLLPDFLVPETFPSSSSQSLFDPADFLK